jgi:hypothetical protein
MWREERRPSQGDFFSHCRTVMYSPATMMGMNVVKIQDNIISPPALVILR